MKLKIIVLLFFLFTVSLFAQNNVNAYKYIIVPKKFDFQKTEDQHQLNSLAKFLFNKEGFSVVFEGDQMPEDLFDNPCLGLKVNTLDTSGMLTTKLIIELLDCRNTKVFTSLEGKSKIKAFKRAYHEALRKAFLSVKNLNYRYDSSLAVREAPQKQDEVEKVIPLVEGETVKGVVMNDEGEEIEFDKVEDKVEVVTEQEEIVDDGKEKNQQIQTTESILYAQTKPFGFQLVDSTPSVVYLLQKSSLKDVYILKNKSGIIYKMNDKWIVEYYEDEAFVQKQLTIKF